MRSVGIDALRVVGIVAVIAGHVWSADPVLAALVYPWHVPVFFFLTGYLWSSGRSLGDEWRKRSQTLGIPYIAWFLVIMVFFVGRQVLGSGLDLQADLMQLAGGANATRPFTTFWFVSVLLATALLYRVICRTSPGVQWAIAAAGIAAGAAFGGFLAHTPLALGSALPCLVFIVAGRSFSLLRRRFTVGLRTGLVVVVVPVVAVATGLSAVPNLKSGDFGTPFITSIVAVIASAALVLVFEAAFARSSPRVGATISGLAMPAVAVVLLHPLVLWVLKTTPEGGWIDFALAVLIPWTIALVVWRTPLSSWLLGAPRRTRAVAVLV
ncbi:acyltransferase family protein [Plantibacter flavus]|uniref:acyltransferase family protein n=1 Tax=Plantibacter flavus TaxID=150123 RepID=UPI003F17A213